ncbi:MAG: HAD family hydrolase [Candidatus Aenigmarchaeota archaeon]|nr:HAD family hydrolase [Candidatus Aenigmarchaeota archaeon]
MDTVVAWDLKGTLITGSDVARAAAFNRYLEGAGYSERVTPEQIEKAGYGWIARMRVLMPDFTPTAGALETLETLQRKEIPKYVRAMPGIETALRRVGRGNSVLVSTSRRSLIGEYLKAAKLEGKFEKVYSVLDDALPAGVGRDDVLPEQIPAYKAYLFGRVVADFPMARIVAVGDRDGDRLAARAAEIEFVGVGHLEELWQQHPSQRLLLPAIAARA